MRDITSEFTKKGNAYVAEVSVDGAFGVQIKTEGRGVVSIGRSFVEGGDPVKVWSENVDGVFGRSFKDAVYPLYLRIVSTSAVVNASIVEA